MRLLLVEDDSMIGAAVQKALAGEGFVVDWVRDGRAAEVALERGNHDVVLLDLGLPRKSGMELLVELRRRGSAVPVVVITARDAVADRIRGLDAGADDYVVKPFEPGELAARIRAVARRRAGRAQPAIRHGALTLDPATRSASMHGEPVSLSPKEFALLAALLDHPGAVVSREALEERLYGWDQEVESNAIEVHIHNLRKKLGATAIHNIRGVGWKIGECG